MNVIPDDEPTLGQSIEFVMLGDEIKKAANEHASLVGDINYKSGELLRKLALVSPMQEYLRGNIDDSTASELVETYINLTAFFRLQGVRFAEIEGNNISSIMYNFEAFLQNQGIQIGDSYANRVLSLLEPRNNLGRFLLDTELVDKSQVSESGTPVPGSDLDKEAELRSLQAADEIRSRIGSPGLGFPIAATLILVIIGILITYLATISVIDRMGRVISNKAAIEDTWRLYRTRVASIDEEFKSGRITQAERDVQLKQAADERDAQVRDISSGPSTGTIIIFSAIGLVAVGVLWNTIFK